MKVYRPDGDPRSLPSWDSRVSLRNFGLSPCEMHWAIDLSDPDVPGAKATFVTVRAISIVRAEIMCGRDTIIWEVVRLKDGVLENKVSRLALILWSLIHSAAALHVEAVLET